MTMRIIPIFIIDKLESIISKFWWTGNHKGNKGLHLISWAKICTPKDWGGLGFRNLRYLNQALIMKSFWEIINYNHNNTSIWCRLIHDIYIKGGDIWEINATYNSSWFWKSIIYVRKYFINNCIIVISMGKTTNIYRDPWILNLTSFTLHKHCPPLTINTVDNIIDNINGEHT